jgi:hypothetical protein
MIKIILGSLSGLFLFIVCYLVFMYFFMKPAKPIMEYEFPNMTYEQLETKISNRNPKRLLDVIDSSKTTLIDSAKFTTIFISLGKDSLRFRFVTYKDKIYKFKTEKRHSTNDSPWIELVSLTDSTGLHYPLNYENKEEHPELIKLFEDEFIKKINNGEVNVIERGFWDWF